MSRPALAMFGSSLVSAYWNGAATYYRGVLRELHALGFDITFHEPDAYERQAHRDIDDPHWARVRVYPATKAGVEESLDEAGSADVVVKASGVGVFDELLEREVANLRATGITTVFWDVDAPATLARVAEDPHDALRELIPRYDLVLTYGGGDPVVNAYRALGARACVPIYNALDPVTHFPVEPVGRFSADLAFLGNRLPDREARVREYFLEPARQLPGRTFLLGGSGWEKDIDLGANVRHVGHVYTHEHNAFNCSPLAVINVNRSSMANTGWSPPTRVFEAAGAGACMLCDAWEGIDEFLEPGREVLVVNGTRDVVDRLAGLTRRRAHEIGAAARRRVLAQHTYAHRAAHLERALQDGFGGHRPRRRAEQAVSRA
jgi:spore maturation protein CgeB